MGRRDYGNWERVGVEYYSPARGWGCPEAEAAVRLVAEKCYSFRDYNRNLYFRRSAGEWSRALPDELSPIERGHFYDVTASGKDGDSHLLVSSVRAADEETAPLVKGLGAWVDVPRYGRQSAVQAFDRVFCLPWESLGEFEARVKALGGEVRRHFVDLAVVAEAERKAQGAAAMFRQAWDELGQAVSRAACPSDLAEVESLAARTRDLACEVEKGLGILRQARERIALEPGRLADKARVDAALRRVEKAHAEVAACDVDARVREAVARVADLEAVRGAPPVPAPVSDGWRRDAEGAFRAVLSAVEEALAVSAALTSGAGGDLAVRAVTVLRRLEEAVSGAEAAVAAARDVAILLRERARRVLDMNEGD
ncbi:MAG: hypothetical protein AB1816_03530 [Bacillota bacterium]